jgi:Recombinational DNA repair protein (RecF pathway)
MLSKERALVITKKNKGEDLYICLLGEESGVFWCVAKHARKSKRRFLNILEPPSLIQAYLRKSKFSQNIIIEKAELENLFGEIKTSLLKIMLAWFSLEITRAVSFSKDAFTTLYEFLLKISSEDENYLKINYEKILYEFSHSILEKEGFISRTSLKSGANTSSTTTLPEDKINRIEIIGESIEKAGRKDIEENLPNLKFIEETLQDIYGRKLKFLSILQLIKKIIVEDQIYLS